MSGVSALPPRGQRILRAALLERLVASTEPLAAIVAPAGYGKSTLLAQWASEPHGRPTCAWIRPTMIRPRCCWAWSPRFSQ